MLPIFTEVSCTLRSRPHRNWIVTVIFTCVVVKNLSAMKEIQIRPSVGRIPWRRKWQPAPGSHRHPCKHPRSGLHVPAGPKPWASRSPQPSGQNRPETGSCPDFPGAGKATMPQLKMKSGLRNAWEIDRTQEAVR